MRESGIIFSIQKFHTIAGHQPSKYDDIIVLTKPLLNSEIIDWDS